MPEQSTGVLVWWAALLVASAFNVALWVDQTRRALPAGHAASHDDVRRFRLRQAVLSGLFVGGCAFRSLLPRVEGKRFCLYDSWLSSVLISRSVATVAELAFVTQWALALAHWSQEDGARRPAMAARLFVPLIAMAELCSWYTTITTNFAGGVIEESIWALTATLATFALFSLYPRSTGVRRRFVGIGVMLATLYAAFMCTVDVPMYALRWKRDQERNVSHLSFTDGLEDSWRRRVVTRRWEDWREEIPWMTLYFTAGVWVSIALIRAPLGTSARSHRRAAGGAARAS